MKKKIEKVALYSAEAFFGGKKDAKPVGWCSNPDKPGPLVLDRKTFEEIFGVKNFSVSQLDHLDDLSSADDPSDE